MPDDGTKFHNPYNFIPAPPRDHLPDGSPLGDRPPAGHDRYHDDRWSGRITVTMTTKTPLLLPDAANLKEKDGHKTYPVRVVGGRPYIPSTSVKGMLRSAYEAITNSRLAIFQGHEARLAYRMKPREGLKMVPARIEKDGESLVIRLLPGTSSIGSDGTPSPQTYAAWLPRYRAGQAVTDQEGTELVHGQEVDAVLELFEHRTWDGAKRTHMPAFDCWQVRAAARPGHTLPELNPSPDPGKRDGVSYHRPKGRIETVRSGYIFVTNQNINRKHEERLFFTHPADERRRPLLTAELVKAWRELIADYQAAHKEKDVWQRSVGGREVPPERFINGNPGKTAWSTQVYQDGKPRRDNEQDQPAAGALQENSLCYARVAATSNGDFTVLGLYPVMISRQLYASSPLDLLPPSLRPAEHLDELSPADRVFGWASQAGHGAYRGNLRIGPVRCDPSNTAPIEYFDESSVPLSILGEPKPQQARFYVAKSPLGGAQADGLDKTASGYSLDKGLRGRKVYPHHAGLPDGYWDNPRQDLTQNMIGERFREYRRPEYRDKDGQVEDRDDQNRSVTGWVKPEVRFEFQVHVTNLSSVELGALLWLLDLPKDHYHRLGGGKPLGFGSVRLDIDKEHPRADLRTGKEWRAAYRSLDEPSGSWKDAIKVAEDLTRLKKDFQAALPDHAPFVQAFLQAARGFEDAPSHYPRARRQSGAGHPVPPHPEGESFKWFVANERPEGRMALPDLQTAKPLPMLDERGGGRSGGGGTRGSGDRDRHGGRGTRTDDRLQDGGYRGGSDHPHRGGHGRYPSGPRRGARRGGR